MGKPGKQRGRHECRKEWPWVACRKSGSAEAGLNGVARAIRDLVSLKLLRSILLLPSITNSANDSPSAVGCLNPWLWRRDPLQCIELFFHDSGVGQRTNRRSVTQLHTATLRELSGEERSPDPFPFCLLSRSIPKIVDDSPRDACCGISLKKITLVSNV
jgi:hypothetical protein